MSEFIKMAKCGLLDHKVRNSDPRFSPLSIKLTCMDSAEWSKMTGDDIQHHYLAGVSWSRSFYCRQSESQKMLDLIIHELRTAVYGDLIQLCRDLERSILERDYNGVLSALDEIKKETMG